MKGFWKEVRDFIIHLRLPFQLMMFFIFLTGFIVGGYSNISNLLLGAIIFFIFISGGTVAYNSYYDNDEGPVNFINNPPKPTKSLLVLSIIFKASGIIFSLLINFKFFIICVAFVFMSVLYSHPKFRFKTKYGLDLVINGVGYGSLSILGGWLCTNSEINFKIIFLSILAFFIVSTGHPLTQIFQYEDDKKKDENTFVVIFGPKKSLLMSLIFLLITLILSNVFFAIYFNFLFNIVISAILLPGTFFLYYWSKNLRIVNNANFLGAAYIGEVIGCVVFSVLILFNL